MGRNRNYEAAFIFAKAYASGKSKNESLTLAGYKPLTTTANLLLKDPKVQEVYQQEIIKFKSTITLDINSVLKTLVKISENSASDNAKVNAIKVLLEWFSKEDKSTQEGQKIIFNISQVNSNVSQNKENDIISDIVEGEISNVNDKDIKQIL